MKIKKKAFTIEKEFQGTIFTIKALTPGEIDRIGDASLSRKLEIDHETKSLKHVIENKRGAERLQQALTAIVGWRPAEDENGVPIPGGDVTDEDGVVIPFGPEAISTMLEYVPGFAGFVGVSVDEAIKARNDMEETLTKNS